MMLIILPKFFNNGLIIVWMGISRFNTEVRSVKLLKINGFFQVPSVRRIISIRKVRVQPWILVSQSVLFWTGIWLKIWLPRDTQPRNFRPQNVKQCLQITHLNKRVSWELFRDITRLFTLTWNLSRVHSILCKRMWVKLLFKSSHFLLAWLLLNPRYYQYKQIS